MSKALPLLAFLGAALLSGCGGLPNSGFLGKVVEPGAPQVNGMQVVEVTEAVTRQLLGRGRTELFSEALGTAGADTRRLGAGDVVEVTIWEAPPATLFTGGMMDTRNVLSVPRAATTLPEQMISADGTINVPFAGQVPAAGKSLSEVEAQIVHRLRRLANQPQVLVRLMRNLSADVTVVGEVATSTRLPLTPRGERLLDALAAAGGVRQPVNKVTIQVTRGRSVHALPLETIIRDPAQNVPLKPGDVVTAYFQPLSFVALGATGKNEEVNFEAQGISLAQALARAGGLLDQRADAQSVFLFRFESRDALSWPRQPVAVTPEGKVPVIYRLDLNDPRSFLVSQSFPIRNKDVLYVANASLAELQKFLNLIGAIVGPVATFKVLTE